MQTTDVEFDAFWLDMVETGIAYFFRWMGPPRATVLTIWDDDGLQSVECRGQGDRELSVDESRNILDEVHRQFASQGHAIAFRGRA